MPKGQQAGRKLSGLTVHTTTIISPCGTKTIRGKKDTVLKQLELHKKVCSTCCGITSVRHLKLDTNGAYPDDSRIFLGSPGSKEIIADMVDRGLGRFTIGHLNGVRIISSTT